jgi:hypothetical protein
MRSSAWPWLVLLLFAAACDSADPSTVDLGSGGDLAAGGDLGGGGGGGGDLAGGDGGAPQCSAGSPSGYACDPWSTHLYVTDSAQRRGSTLRLQLQHNPDFEGAADDTMIPPAHDYFQQLTVDLELTESVRRFICVVLTAAATPASFDASSPSFFSDVDPGFHGLVPESFPDPPPVADLIDICGGATLPAARWPALVNPSGDHKPILPAIVLAIPLTPSPRQFQAGTSFGAWLARGVLDVDEESELSPELTATVVAVQ